MIARLACNFKIWSSDRLHCCWCLLSCVLADMCCSLACLPSGDSASRLSQSLADMCCSLACLAPEVSCSLLCWSWSLCSRSCSLHCSCQRVSLISLVLSSETKLTFFSCFSCSTSPLTDNLFFFDTSCLTIYFHTTCVVLYGWPHPPNPGMYTPPPNHPVPPLSHLNMQMM